MGLIRATLGSASSVMGDQFKEFVTIGETGNQVLVQRGIVNHGKGNSNPTEGIITNGSKIVVPEGHAMMIVDNGAIKEFSAEPGEFIWDSSSEPSVFEGGFFKGIGDSIKKIGNRITYGGQAAKDQRVYYVNLLTITGNKFGSPNSEVVVDPVYGSVEITFFGEYSFKVIEPTTLVANLLGTMPKDTVTCEDVVGGQLKLQFSNKVSTCISDLMISENLSFNVIQREKEKITEKMNGLLDESWKNQYGLEIQDVVININATDETKEIIRNVDAEIAREKRRGALYSENASGLMAAATASAMENASSNENGAMMGFAGMNMASSAGGAAMEAAKGVGVASTNAKFCSQCGAPVTGNFCSQCGNKIE